jgi:hypothetical protein
VDALTLFKRISASNVIEMELSTTKDQTLHGMSISGNKTGNGGFQLGEKRPVFDEGDFYAVIGCVSVSTRNPTCYSVKGEEGTQVRQKF